MKELKIKELKVGKLYFLVNDWFKEYRVIEAFNETHFLSRYYKSQNPSRRENLWAYYKDKVPVPYLDTDRIYRLTKEIKDEIMVEML